MNFNIQANEATYKIKRVPAEWEPQEAIWMQWPGYWEKDYELTFAKITSIISRYEKLHILYNSDQIYTEAQKSIRDIVSDPQHKNIYWHKDLYIKEDLHFNKFGNSLIAQEILKITE